MVSRLKQSPGQELNLRRPVFQAGALPLSYLDIKWFFKQKKCPGQELNLRTLFFRQELYQLSYPDRRRKVE